MTEQRPANPQDKLREAMRAQLANGFAPDPFQTDVGQRQTRALEFIAFALGELVQEMQHLRRDIQLIGERRV
jgi:hypothetical protein